MSCIDKRKLTVKRHLLFMISSNFSISSSFVKFVFKILFRQLIFHLTSPPQSSPLFIEFDYNWEPITLSKTLYWGESIIVVQSTKAWWLSQGCICLPKLKDEMESDESQNTPSSSWFCFCIFSIEFLHKVPWLLLWDISV